MTDTHELLRRLGACPDGMEWAGSRTIEQVWAECPRADWMLWLLEQVQYDDALVLREFACWCVRQEPCWGLLTDARSRVAVEVAERYARGEATAEELSAASTAADAAARAARDARDAARAAWATADAAAYAAAADAAAYAAAAARAAVRDAFDAADAADAAAWAAWAAEAAACTTTTVTATAAAALAAQADRLRDVVPWDIVGGLLAERSATR